MVNGRTNYERSAVGKELRLIFRFRNAPLRIVRDRQELDDAITPPIALAWTSKTAVRLLGLECPEYGAARAGGMMEATAMATAC